MESFDCKKIKKELMLEAKAVDIPAGAAEIFIDHAIKNVKKVFTDKRIITDKDLERAITRELKKYNTDLAYVYKNRDKII